MKMPGKTTLIRSAITVAVLVVAIVGGSLFAASKRAPTPKSIQLDAATQSKADYDKAVIALSREETASALILLERALTIDPSNAAAKTKLAELKKKSISTGTGDGGSGGTGGTPTTTTPDPNKPDPFLGVIELGRLLPTSMEGVSLGSAQIIAPDATIAGEPDNANSGAINVVWAVHDRENEAAAQKFLDGVSKGLYTKDQSTVNVRGVTAFFGTDGTRFASVAYRRGRYVFEVIVTPTGPPISAKALAEKAAAAFPAAP